jgi:hypothetical protein
MQNNVMKLKIYILIWFYAIYVKNLKNAMKKTE